MKQEEENFALFNYVNELSHEVETLNESVQRLQDSIGEEKPHTNHFSPWEFFSTFKSEIDATRALVKLEVAGVAEEEGSLA